MNILTIFCYVTVMCDTQVKPAASAQKLQSVNQNVTQTNDGRKTIRETSSYPTRYDYIDIEAVMNNERIIKILFNCVMSRGPCTREGLELKRIVPDAIQTECAKCNERQRKQAGKVLAHLLQYKPEYWKMLVQKFDPNNIYLRKYMADNDDDEKLSLQKLSNDTTKKKRNIKLYNNFIIE